MHYLLEIIVSVFMIGLTVVVQSFYQPSFKYL